MLGQEATEWFPAAIYIKSSVYNRMMVIKSKSLSV